MWLLLLFSIHGSIEKQCQADEVANVDALSAWMLIKNSVKQSPVAPKIAVKSKQEIN